MEPNSNTPAPDNSTQSRTLLVVTLTIAVLAIAIVAAMLINGNSSAPSTTNQTETTQQDTPDATEPSTNTDETAVETATITFTDNGFSPSTLTVKKGAKITVVNNSSDPVQLSSADHPTHQENPELNMEELAPGESGTITVSTVGTHGYHDHIDESKTGTLVVTE